MDPEDLPTLPGKPSPRREVHLQGPRPTPLKIRKDSHKIKKPPAAAPGPSQSHHHAPPPPPQQQQPPRQPVIIYAVSPKVIHIEPGNFMTLVQRLTGASPRTLAASGGAAGYPGDRPSCPSPCAAAPGDLSPAARFAAMERGTHRSSSPAGRAAVSGHDDDIVRHLGISGAAAPLDRPGSFPGILSPLPSALPPISSTFFPPPAGTDPSALAFLNEMSPIFRNNTGGFVDGPFLPSPGNFLSTPTMPSPGALWEFFGQL